MKSCIGIVLSVLDFQENGRILTVFSPNGLMKFVAKKRHSPLFTVLNQGEFVYAIGKGELHRFWDGKILSQYLALRERLESLETAGILVRGIQKSQMLGKPAPQLYQLFCYCLHAISTVDNPFDIASIFLVKTMKHEGLFQTLNQCSICQLPPSLRYGGERFCAHHGPKGALELTLEEEKWLIKFTEGRSLKQLLIEPTNLLDKITILFNQTFSN
ncbi:MAG: DNA repair protein RecO [Chlamydiales bacterium]